MFASLVGAFLAVQFANPRRGQLAAVTVAGGVGFLCFGLANLVNSAVGDRLRKPFLTQRLGHRYDSLIHEGAGLPSMVVRIEDARTYHRAKLSPEDIGIAFFDAENRRLLVEGVSHRYVIRGEDVTCLRPLAGPLHHLGRGSITRSAASGSRSSWPAAIPGSPSGPVRQPIVRGIRRLRSSQTLGWEPGTWDLLDPTP